MKDVLASTGVQILLVITITYLSYLMFSRKEIGFFKWIGLYLPKNRDWVKSAIVVFIASLAIMVGPLILFQYLGYITPEMFLDQTISGQGLSISIVIMILLKAIIQTSLTEEILFRGFIGKRIAHRLGFKTGNVIQALIFGLPHGLPFMIVYKQYIIGITLIITAGIVGYLQFWLNEKKARGSIVPSILIHGIMNILSFSSKALG
ncbi:MAG: CPBP family intramembrane glutamic endopeptidase [Tissierellales bacterium]